MRAGRRDASRGEGRHVQFVIGAEDQRRAQHIDAPAPDVPRPRERRVDRRRSAPPTRSAAPRSAAEGSAIPSRATAALEDPSASGSRAAAAASIDCARATNGTAGRRRRHALRRHAAAGDRIEPSGPDRAPRPPRAIATAPASPHRGRGSRAGGRRSARSTTPESACPTAARAPRPCPARGALRSAAAAARHRRASSSRSRDEPGEACDRTKPRLTYA